MRGGSKLHCPPLSSSSLPRTDRLSQWVITFPQLISTNMARLEEQPNCQTGPMGCSAQTFLQSHVLQYCDVYGHLHDVSLQINTSLLTDVKHIWVIMLCKTKRIQMQDSWCWTSIIYLFCILDNSYQMLSIFISLLVQICNLIFYFQMNIFMVIMIKEPGDCQCKWDLLIVKLKWS